MELVHQRSSIRRVGGESSHLFLSLTEPSGVEQSIERWSKWFDDFGETSLSRHPNWMLALRDGMGIKPYCLEARWRDSICGLLPLGLTRSPFFGRYLISLPYVNYGGVIAEDAKVADSLITEATYMADRLNVKHLQLRHEEPIAHWQLGKTLTNKVHMRLDLPGTSGQLWDSFQPKVRNQVRKGIRAGIQIRWGEKELLDDFYDVFALNMRDLGTPVFGRSLFAAMLNYFPGKSELCVAYLNDKAIAAAILLHGKGTTEVPSASSLRSHNHTNANMLMYWHLLQRAVDHGQDVFDFGRSSTDSGPHRFKKQWGAEPVTATWQFYVRQDRGTDARLESRKYDRMVYLWQQLPISVSRWLGPWIVRGILDGRNKLVNSD